METYLFILVLCTLNLETMLTAIHTGDCQEGYSLLDKTLNVVEEEDLYIKKVKPNDVFYVVPAIVGGGGKRTTTLLAVAALGVATGGLVLASSTRSCSCRRFCWYIRWWVCFYFRCEYRTSFSNLSIHKT